MCGCWWRIALRVARLYRYVSRRLGRVGNVLREGTVPYVREEAGPGRDDEVEEAERLYQALGGGYNSGPYVCAAEGWFTSSILHAYAH